MLGNEEQNWIANGKSLIQWNMVSIPLSLKKDQSPSPLAGYPPGAWGSHGSSSWHQCLFVPVLLLVVSAGIYGHGCCRGWSCWWEGAQSLPALNRSRGNDKDQNKADWSWRCILKTCPSKLLSTFLKVWLHKSFLCALFLLTGILGRILVVPASTHLEGSQIRLQNQKTY